MNDVHVKTLGAICLVLAWLPTLSPSVLAQCPGEVRLHQKISEAEGDLPDVLDELDVFGSSVALLGDLDGDGVDDVAVGAIGDDDGGLPPDADHGAVWILFLNNNGTVKAVQKISDTEGNFTGTLDVDDRFGASVASLGDLDGVGPGVLALAVGATGDDDGGVNRGAVWILFLDDDGTVLSHQKISDTAGNFTGELHNVDVFGVAVTSLGDLDGEGPSVLALAVGAANDSDNGFHRGAVWILFLNDQGTVLSHQKINDLEGGFTGVLDDSDLFGFSASALEDLDGDGVGDLAVGAFGDDDGSPQAGAAWILFLNDDGTVKAHQKISATEGNFTGTLEENDILGTSVASLEDLDGNGIGDLAVGAKRDDDGGLDCGAVWVLLLDEDGTVKAHRKISATEGNFTGELGVRDQFGFSVVSMGDSNGDGVGDLVVGAALDDDGGYANGAVWLLFLNAPLSLDVEDDLLSWGPPAGATAYDVVRGDLGSLRSSGGDFAQATDECLAPNHGETSLSYSVPPNPGEGFWFLARRQQPFLGNMTYDICGPSQVGSRDAEIAASGVDCP